MAVVRGFVAGLLLAGSLLVLPASAAITWPPLAPQVLPWLAEQIYRNECAAKPENLVHWNRGEEFPSLGIGHFIWYPQGQDGPFEESFPQLLDFLQQRGMTLPPIVQQPGAPWSDRARFEAAKGSAELDALRQFLLQTRQAQFEFIVLRFQQQLPALLSAAGTQREAVEDKISAILATPAGLYPLIDYQHFKGSGLHPAERYQGQGWGLLQVLLAMDADNDDPIAAFQAAARTTLKQRADNAPPARNEARWLPGWNRRIDSYASVPAFGRS